MIDNLFYFFWAIFTLAWIKIVCKPIEILLYCLYFIISLFGHCEFFNTMVFALPIFIIRLKLYFCTLCIIVITLSRRKYICNGAIHFSISTFTNSRSLDWIIFFGRLTHFYNYRFASKRVIVIFFNNNNK